MANKCEICLNGSLYDMKISMILMCLNAFKSNVDLSDFLELLKFGNPLEITYYINNKFLSREPIPRQNTHFA